MNGDERGCSGGGAIIGVGGVSVVMSPLDLIFAFGLDLLDGREEGVVVEG